MKINDQINKGINPAVEKSNSSVETHTPSQQVQATIAAKNEITSATISATVQSIQSLVSAGPAFDAKKVDALRAEIESGKFSVDSGKVADGLIANSVALFKSGSKS